MRCKAARTLFSAAFDAELSVSEEREFNGHLEGCSLCSREFSLFVKSVELVTSLPRPSESPLFEQKLINALNADKVVPRRPEPRVPLLTPRPAVAFATVLVLVGLLVMLPTNQPDWESGLVTKQLAVSELAMSELAATRLGVTGSGDVQLQSLAASALDDALVSSVDGGSLSGDELSLWSRDAGVPSTGQAGDAIALLSDGTGNSGVVLEVEFVLDPFLFEGAEVRRVDTSPSSDVEIEPVSMTF
jgi:anti-sigma factor RsiW